MALRGDACRFEGAEEGSLGASVEEGSLLVDPRGFQERKRYLVLSHPLGAWAA